MALLASILQVSFLILEGLGLISESKAEMQYDSGPRESAKQALDEAAHQAHYYQPRQLALQDLHQSMVVAIEASQILGTLPLI